MNSEYKNGKIRKKIHKIEEKIDLKLLMFRVFDDPRPKYIAKVTVIDRVVDVLFLWAFPQYIRPNYVTLFRLISIPFIIFFLSGGYYKIALVMFVVSAFSDAVDGAIARTRNKITDWGIFFDPFTDKLLIGIVGGMLIFIFLNPILAGILISIEFLLGVSAYYRFKGELVPAKTVGKIKMILECFGVSLILLFLAIGYPIILVLASYILYLAILFAILSLLVYRSI